MLILRKNTCIRLLESPRTQREVKILIKAQVGFALSVFLLQIVVLGLMCAIESCIVKEFMGLETKREEMGRKRGRKVAHVRAEAMVQEAHMEEVRVREFEEKNENKYGQWVKPDFEA
ncbi:hypothetical protein AMTR_s00024p00237990 [Amborella trichopoda]|uniref:Uncharacterized protein n=2 Tax=Amborella trichopoda TaxID=13333 RepID=W1PTX0_AMBTC|nr:hypothetical protein AMTR_s00024p00237990 [Amborella trichopoda]